MLIVANLDAEAELAGETLSAGTMRTVAAIGTLLRFLATSDDDRVWTPLPVDPARVPDVPGRARVRLISGPLERPVDREWTAWARTPSIDPAAGAILRVVAHRRFAWETARRVGDELPGSAMLGSPAALRRHLAAGGADLAPNGGWVLKAPYSAAGRWRLRDGADDAAVERFFARFGEGLFEPWLERVADGGVAAEVDAGGAVPLVGRHDQVVDARGRFRGVRPGGAPDDDEARVARAVGAALHARGYIGPFGVDGWTGLDRAGNEVRRLVGEINPRLTMGRVARRVAAEGETLRIGREIPARARPLLLGADDPTVAWLEP